MVARGRPGDHDGRRAGERLYTRGHQRRECCLQSRQARLDERAGTSRGCRSMRSPKWCGRCSKRRAWPGHRSWRAHGRFHRLLELLRPRVGAPPRLRGSGAAAARGFRRVTNRMPWANTSRFRIWPDTWLRSRQRSAPSRHSTSPTSRPPSADGHGSRAQGGHFDSRDARRRHRTHDQPRTLRDPGAPRARRDPGAAPKAPGVSDAARLADLLTISTDTTTTHRG